MRRIIVGLLLAATAAGPVWAQTTANPVVNSYLARGLTSAEAQRRIELSRTAAQLQQRIAVEEPVRFAGLYIDDGTDFRVVVRLVGNADGLLQKYTTDPAFVAEKAEKPLRAQLNKKAAMERAMDARKLDYSSDYDVRSGRFRIAATKPAEAKNAIAGAATTDDVDLVQVD